MDTPLQIVPGEGWKVVAPRAVSQRLVYDDGKYLCWGATDFVDRVDLDYSSEVDCPLAGDRERGKVWRYRCQLDLGRRDYSEIREYDVASGTSRTLVPLELNQWVVWLCRYLPDYSLLLALLATDLTRAGSVVIRHNYALIDMRSGKMRTVPLCRDAYCPLDVDSRKKMVVFNGAEGFHLVSFAGNKLQSLAGTEIPRGRGAHFHPSEPTIVVGGGGLALWNIANGSVRRLHDQGHWPLWDTTGEGLYYSLSSSDLWHYNRVDDRHRLIVSVADNPHPEVAQAMVPQPSIDGRYLALTLTRKVAVAGEASRQSNWQYQKALCILDCKLKEMWTVPVQARYCYWV